MLRTFNTEALPPYSYPAVRLLRLPPFLSVVLDTRQHYQSQSCSRKHDAFTVGKGACPRSSALRVTEGGVAGSRKKPRIFRSEAVSVPHAPGWRGILVELLRRERRPAAAAAGGVRVLKSETRAHHIRRVIDRHAVQILRREHIDKELDAVLIDEKIA